MHLKMKIAAAAIGIAVLCVVIKLYGMSEYRRGKSEAENAALAAKSDAQTQNATILKEVNNAVRKIPDTQLDSAAANLGILRPDSAY